MRRLVSISCFWRAVLSAPSRFFACWACFRPTQAWLRLREPVCCPRKQKGRWQTQRLLCFVGWAPTALARECQVAAQTERQKIQQPSQRQSVREKDGWQPQLGTCPLTRTERQRIERRDQRRERERETTKLRRRRFTFLLLTIKIAQHVSGYLLLRQTMLLESTRHIIHHSRHDHDAQQHTFIRPSNGILTTSPRRRHSESGWTLRRMLQHDETVTPSTHGDGRTQHQMNTRWYHSRGRFRADTRWDAYLQSTTLGYEAESESHDRSTVYVFYREETAATTSTAFRFTKSRRNHHLGSLYAEHAPCTFPTWPRPQLSAY